MDSPQIHFSPDIIVYQLLQAASGEAVSISSAPRGTPSSMKNPDCCWGLEIYHSLGPFQQFLLRSPKVGHFTLSASLCDLSSPRISCPEGHQHFSKTSDSTCNGGGWNYFILCWSTTLLIQFNLFSAFCQLLQGDRWESGLWRLEKDGRLAAYGHPQSWSKFLMWKPNYSLV